MPRRKSYDPTIARQRATKAFWRHGFQASSIGDLEKAMGVNRFAIQTFFGGKDALYESCLDEYLAGTELTYFARIAPGGLHAITDFFDMLTTPERVWPEAAFGCLLVNSLTEPIERGEPRVRRQTKRYLEGLRAAFTSALQAAAQSGEIKPGLDRDECARFLVTLVLGVHLLNRSEGNITAAAPTAAVLRDVLASWRR